MKKKALQWCLGAMAAGVVAACGGSKDQVRDAEGFPPTEILAADSIAIEEVLQPQWGGVYGDYAVLISPQTSKVVWRYRLPEWTLVDSSLVMGGGPDDLQYAFLQGSNGYAAGSFWLSEPIKHVLMRFSDDPDGGLRKDRTVSNRSLLTIYFGQVLNDKVAVADRMQNKGYEKSVEGLHTFLYSGLLEGDDFQVTDSVLCYTVSDMHVEKSGSTTYVTTRTYNRPTYRAFGDRLAVWYGDTENMLVYRVDDAGKMSLEAMYGDTLSLSQAFRADLKNIDREYPSPKFIAATQDHLYLQTPVYDKPISQSTEENPAKLIRNEIRVYDWQMNPAAKFQLDRPGDWVYVDPLHGCFYAYDSNLDFEQVYVYRFEL